MYSIKKRYNVVFGYIGNLFTYFPLTILVPILFCFFYPNEWINSWPFIWAALISFIFGMLLKTSTKVEPGSPVTIQEGAIIVVLAWVFGIVFSALPFVFGGLLSFSHAIFESTSGWTTTGLTLVDVTKIPRLFLVWRSLMQFYGGAGFAIIMMSAILGPGGFGLYHAEGRVDNLVPNIKSSVRRILVIYFTYAVVGFLLYKVAGMGWFDSFNHSLTALATGGFSTRSGSIQEFNSVSIEAVTILLMILGTTGFGIHHALWKANFKALSKNGEPKLMFIIIVSFIPLLMFSTINPFYSSIGASFRNSIFQVVSALSGTGFSTMDFVPWNSIGLYLITLLMIFGGDLDSTSGGLKQYRLFVLLKVIAVEIKEFFLPKNSVVRTEVWKGENRRFIDREVIKEILIVFSMYFITYAIGVGITASYGHSLEFSAFEFASALSTVGLSVGITTPQAPLGLIWTETIGMFLGRLEFLVIIYGLTKLIKDASYSIRSRKSEVLSKR